MFGGVVQCRPDGGGLVIFDDGAGGAVGGALAALHAGRLGKRDVAGRGHAGVDAAVQERKRPDILQLLADLHAAAALDALGEIQDDGAIGIVGRDRGDDALDALGADAEVGGERLQFARAVAAAGEAAVGMRREEQFEHRAADLGELAAVGGDIHVLDNRGAAGPRHARLAGDLDDAHPAGGGRLNVVVLAEGGNFHLHLPGGFEDGRAGGHGDGLAVDLEIDGGKGSGGGNHGGGVRRWRVRRRRTRRGGSRTSSARSSPRLRGRP